MIRIFCGYDKREAEGFHAFVQSVVDTCSEPVAITPLVMNSQRDGTNAFTYSRFLVPHLCQFRGYAIFADGSDMLSVGDLAELWEQRSGWHALQVVKHDYKTKYPRKYVGTAMECANEDYERKNWSSLIVWNCGHYLNSRLTPSYIQESTGAHLHRFQWLPDERIGTLAPKWNWLADEMGENADAQLLHWTAGMPGFAHYSAAPMSHKWHETVRTFHSQR